MKLGVHQGSVLSPLLFTIELEALSGHFRQGLPWELFYADDLVLLAESREILMKFKIWKEGLESKGLKVNIGKTKVMKCHVDANMQVESGKYPCGICGKGVGGNSIQCGSVRNGSIRNAVRVMGKLKKDPGYRCAKCGRLRIRWCRGTESGT